MRKSGNFAAPGTFKTNQLNSTHRPENDLGPCTVICKAGSVDTTEIGIPAELKVRKGSQEAICKPILQAKLPNVTVGLCAGHDSLFIRHSKAPGGGWKALYLSLDPWGGLPAQKHSIAGTGVGGILKNRV
ncbi:MAG: DUF1847 domain-containing protein [Syntrophobacteraceae bacterium]